MNNHSVVEVRVARLPGDLDFIRQLWIAYLTWGNNQMQMLYGVHPHHPEEAVEQDIKNIDKFLSPSGRLMLAFNGPTPVGIGCLKRIHSKTAEIKRMYVDPSFRGYGTGRAILDALLKDAQEAGYKNVFLDNPKFMEAAHSLYRSFGFKEIPAYPESEIPEQFRQHLLFMGLNLNSLPATK